MNFKMNSESVLNKNMESLKSNLNSILCSDSHEDKENEFASYPLQVERYDNPTYELTTMMNNCAINYGSFKNSHNVMERNFCSTPRKGDAMTPALNFNFNLNGLFQQTMTNAYGYDQENLSHFTRNNNVKKNDVNYLNVNLKKIIKNRIHSKKLKSQKPQLKPRMPIENYLSLKGPPVMIDMNRTGILQRLKLQNMSDCKLIQNLIEDWCFFLSKLVNDRKVVQSDVFHYYDKDNKFVDFSLMIKNKSLEQSIALLINETFEESNHSPMILSMMYQHCKDRGIIVEETHEIYWLDIEDALMKIWDPKKGITSGNATINLMNSMGNFLNKVVGKMWMDFLNELIDVIKKLVTYVWTLQVMIKSCNNSEAQKHD